MFEAVKVVEGHPFALTRHLRRLGRSAAGLGLPAPDETRVREAVSAVLAGSEAPLGRLRITYTGGPAPMGSGRAAHATPTLVVALGPLAPRTTPSAAVTVPWPRNKRGALAGLKTTSYAENVVALAYAAERGGDEAIFANLAGHLCEGTGSNVFYVVDGELRTPTLASGCLAGITRELLLEWCEVVEVDEPIEVLGTRRRGVPGLDHPRRAGRWRGWTPAPGTSRAPSSVEPPRSGASARPSTPTREGGGGFPRDVAHLSHPSLNSSGEWLLASIPWETAGAAHPRDKQNGPALGGGAGPSGARKGGGRESVVGSPGVPP